MRSFADERAASPDSGVMGRGARAVVAILLGGVFGGPACERGPAAVVVAPQPPSFVEITAAAGVTRTTQTYDAALADYDGDGRPDLFVGNHAAPAVLLHNRDGQRLAEVIASSGLDPQGDKHGAAWGDYDGDGRPDLYVSVGAGRGTQRKQNRLYRNEGEGRFRDVAEAAGVTDPTGRSRSVAWFDADRDGRLDLLVTNYATPNRLFLGRPDGPFADTADAWGVAEPGATRLAWGDVDGDRGPDLILTGTPKGLRFLRNRAGHGFEDATQASGLADIGRSVAGAALGDVDGDGDQDLYLAYGEDFSDGVLDRGDGTLTFAFFARGQPTGFDFTTPADGDGTIEVEVFENGGPLAPARIACGNSAMSQANRLRCPAASASSTEMPDVASLVLWSDSAPSVEGGERRWHLRWREPGDHHVTGLIHGARRPVAVGFAQGEAGGGSLWLGDGRGRFRESARSGIVHQANSQLVQLADANADGTLDLYVVDSGRDGAGGRNLLFLGRGDGTFVPAGEDAGVSPDSGAGRGVGAHFFDLDADGRLDLFLTNGWGAPPFDQGPYRLLHNRAPGAPAWLAVELRGRTSNRFGLGAWIDVTGCGRTQSRLHNGMANGYSQSLLPVPFGWGDCREPLGVRVRWPSGIDQELTDVVGGRVLTIAEPEAGAR